MNHDTEPRVRNALAALAARGGQPDESAAWERIVAGMDVERRSSRRRRAVLATAGLAVLGSAAAVVALVAVRDEPRHTVKVVPPASTATSEAPTTVTEPAPTTVTEPASPTVTDPGPTEVTEPPDVPVHPAAVAASGPVPEHPVAAVVSPGNGPSYIAVYDGDTGEQLGTPVGPSFFGYGSLSFGPDGTLWFAEEFGDTHAVSRVAWGSTAVEQPVGMESNHPTVSPDGRFLAYVHDGVTVERPSVRIVDLTTGEQTAELAWAEDEDDFFFLNGSIAHLEWSPDGSRLLFANSYEGVDLLVVDPGAASLSEATFVPVGSPSDVAWAGPDRVVVIENCCYPEHETWEVRVYDVASGEYTVPDVGGRAVAVEARPDGTVGVLTEDGVLHYSDGRSVDLGDVGYAVGF